MMDGRRMDVAGGRAVRRERRGRKLAVVVAVQNVLVVACLLATLYVYWGAQRQEQRSDKNVHIEFGTIIDTEPNQMLHLHHVESSYLMNLTNDKIHIRCSGPYFLKMDVCSKRIGSGPLISGTLQLEVVGRMPETNFTLATSNEDCRKLDRIVYLRAEEQASLRWSTQDHLRIKNATLSLTYLLGAQCQQ